MKRFKAEKAKIVGCDDSITIAAFQKRLTTNHPLFGEMIMKEDVTLVDSFALTKKHALGRRLDEQKRCPSSLEKSRQLLKERRTGISPTRPGRKPSVGINPRTKKAR
ncbi:hypothetical protein ACFX1X_043898 [Malus domestica]